MGVWFRIFLTDLVVMFMSLIMQNIYKGEENPTLHYIAMVITSMAVTALPIISIIWIWA